MANLMFKIIDKLTKGISSMNFCVTDGNIIVCSRYISININNEKPPSMYLSIGEEYISNNKSSYMKTSKITNCVIISSEPIDNNIDGWELVPQNTILSVDNSNKINITDI